MLTDVDRCIRCLVLIFYDTAIAQAVAVAFCKLVLCKSICTSNHSWEFFSTTCLTALLLLVCLQEDIEKEELRVELALADKTTHKRLEHRDTAAHEVANGIDAFEMTLKRFGGGEDEPAVSGTTAGADGQGGARSGTANGSSGQTPMETLNRIRTFAPTTAKLTEEAGEYLTTITARRKEENLTRKEREVREVETAVTVMTFCMCYAANSSFEYW